ncbi:component of the polarisome [Tulasnella sp. 418]|nr:component of the polarisome [Tulasnella sp. 418]
MSRRAPSPTSTTFSGISNYRSDNYKPTRDKPGSSQIPAVPSMDSRATARIHFDELQRFLASHLAKVPFLPVREDFHPKRNQARQKLATLPPTRFKDLSSDVFYELGRRYPEFKEPEVPETPGSEYDDSEAPKARSSPDQERSVTSSGRKPSQDTYQQDNSERRRQPSQDTLPSQYPPGRNLSQSEDTIRSFTKKPSLDQSNAGHYRRPSQPTRQQSQDDGYGGSGGSAPGFPSSATSGVVIPNKSTIAEEEIQVPYGKDDELSSGSDMQPNGRAQNANSLAAKSKRVMSTGYGALGANLLNAPLSPTSEDDATPNTGVDRRGQSEIYDSLSFGRASVTSATSVGYRGGREEREEAEKMRSEYEFKIATMQNRITNMDGELRTAKDTVAEYDDRVRSLTEELAAFRSRAEEQSNAMRALQKELEEARALRRSDSVSYDKEQNKSDARVRALQDKVQELEQELYDNRNSGSVNGSEVAGLRQEMQSLVDELRDLSSRNDQLTAEKEADQATIYNLTSQVKDYKRKYEHAKTELRNFKATSQLFHPQSPRSDDQLPIAENGGILDIHVTAFQSAIDGLLSAARSSQPSSVLAQMKSVVTAVAAITDDIRTFEQRPPSQRRGVEDDALRSLRDRADATLSNLVTACKSHALANGMSPVSLMDAAASHVSACVVEICKTIMMRKSTVADRERERQAAAAAAASSLTRLGSLSGAGGRSSPGPKTLEELKAAEKLHGRTASDSSQWSNANGSRLASKTKMTMSDRSSNSSPQPPMIFDKGGAGGTSDEEGGDEAWEELKPYLDAQSEAIVVPIRSLLSAIRAGADVAELNENLTQIITIVSSIVAVCKDALPASSVEKGEELLAQLSENCNKLSELQGMSEMTKQTRQAMASSSFTVAKAMKELRAL